MTKLFTVTGSFNTADYLSRMSFIPVLYGSANKNSIVSSLSIENAKNGIILTRVIKNAADVSLPLIELQTSFSGLSFGKNAEDDYFYTNENPHLYGQFTIPIDFDRADPYSPANARFGLEIDTSYADPGVLCERILSSPYQPFPAVLLSNYQSDTGLIFGSVSQDVFCHNVLLRHRDGGIEMTVISCMKDIDYRILLPGEELVDRFYLGVTDKAQDINNIFDGYTDTLRILLRGNCACSDVNRHTMIWGSWNDGIYRDVSEEMLLREARAVKRLFPNVEWFQLDDGYSAHCEKNVDLDADGIGVPYVGENGVDKAKFPNGLRHYTDEIRRIGLRPSVWIGGLCPVKTRIFRERPEWFIDYRYRLDWAQPLDVSVPEARAYMKKALDVFVDEYGFEGVKHDFWSYAFEDRHPLLRGKDRSGYEYRAWWLQTIRDKLGNGYLQAGCDVATGNPFLGKYFNNYRFGEDVAAGIWRRVLATVLAGVSVLTTQTGDLLIPNSDSIGLLPGLNDRDYMFVVNYQIITRTLVEICGLFSKVSDDHPRLAVIKRATKYLNNGENVYFPNYDYRAKGKIFPEVIYIKSPFDGAPEYQYTVALFNPFETERTVTVRAADFGLSSCRFTEVWAPEKKEEADGMSVRLAPHESRLYYISF